MGNLNLVSTNVYAVKEVVQLVIDDDNPIGRYMSFFAADDACCELETKGLKVYIESYTVSGPIITDDDLDMVEETFEWDEDMIIDPRDAWKTDELRQVLYYLQTAAELKSMHSTSNEEHHMYETLVYGYDQLIESMESMI
jgi:hypothetical protein